MPVAIDVHRSEKSRHLVLRVSAGEAIPDALMTTLRAERITCGWLRGSGVLADVELRAYDAEIGALGSARRIEGPAQVLILEGSIGLSDGDPSFSMRALLARESDFGLETMAGEIGSARVVALEVVVTALDDLTLHRGLDDAAGLWLLGDATGQVSAAHGPPARPMTRPAWSAALEASERADREPTQRQAPGSTAHGGGIPARPRRPVRAAEPD
ncbi:MAG: DNA-binding protein, partial [Myxococcota bacterium]|nr:DNA-binding protein [Myxococcota bacterium]